VPKITASCGTQVNLAPANKTKTCFAPRDATKVASGWVPRDRPGVPERASAGHKRPLPGDENEGASYLLTDLAPANGTKTCFALRDATKVASAEVLGARGTQGRAQQIWARCLAEPPQAKKYAQLLDVPLAYATNGEGIVEDDRNTGRESHLPAARDVLDSAARQVRRHGIS